MAIHAMSLFSWINLFVAYLNFDISIKLWKILVEEESKPN